MSTDRNLPATAHDRSGPDPHDEPVVAPQRPLSVAYLPLALVTFIILAFIIAAWTFLAAAG